MALPLLSNEGLVLGAVQISNRLLPGGKLLHFLPAQLEVRVRVRVRVGIGLGCARSCCPSFGRSSRLWLGLGLGLAPLPAGAARSVITPAHWEHTHTL